MPDEPSNWELARGLKDIKDALDKVITQREWQAYQTGLDQRIADLGREQTASVIRHNADVAKLERTLAEHSKQSAEDKKELQNRQAGQRFAMVVLALTLLGTFVLQFVQIGSAG